MNNRDLPTTVIAPSVSNVKDRAVFSPVFPSYIGRALGKIDRSKVAMITERNLLKKVKEGDVVYLWHNITDDFLFRLKDKGVFIFREKLNTLQIEAKKTLDEVYGKLGIKPTHGLTDAAAERDLRQLDLVDHIFVANPIAAASYGKHGVDDNKIISSSYGWDKNRFSSRLSLEHKEKTPFTAAFVGVAALRKGVDLLIQAWVNANVKGKLIIVGTVDDELRRVCGHFLERDDIIVTGWMNDPAPAVSEADILVFPSHDEGGPLVTYEAMGAGLPVLVSPYGAGAIVRDGVDGYVIDPYDIDAWTKAIQILAFDKEMRAEFSSNALKRAEEFVWPKVGTRRREDILARIK